MGVPKFYRWLSERYPKINQIVTDTALLPEFDHLYLDMNGIIHGCTHPAHMDISDVLSERDMMLGIMHYLDRIITQIVKPKVSVFLAIDGVAPRAKLNQQRSRRFRSAKDMAEALEEKESGSTTTSNNKEQLFDSNCITPGTEFMDKVSSMIRYWIRSKLQNSTDPLWSSLKVIFSGPEVPGEGEHKIMQHIRELKSQPNYPPNTRHVMYGQDADLIMLGLVSHEPHFTLLREIVQFGMPRPQGGVQAVKSVKRFTKESDFQLLHLSVLREYLQLEFCNNNSEYDLERVVDDFVFITFFVGNDFLPHLPALDIGDGAFDLLFRTYTEERQSWGTVDNDTNPYLVYKGEVCSLSRLESFIAKIGAHESEILAQKEDDDATFLVKRRRWSKRDFGTTEGIPTDAELRKSEAQKEQSYRDMLLSVNGKATVSGWTPTSNNGRKDYKGRYYYEKLRLTPCHIAEHQALRRYYMEGLLWCLAYYYKGCVSWSWYFPYHYGPMLSDLMELDALMCSSVTTSFDLGRPLLPFEQLMGCLPPASAGLLPKPYRTLMTSPQSPILHFYPTSFTVDMNGKRNPWEGVNLLPFIDSKLLQDTLRECIPPSALSVKERNRNRFGPVDLYVVQLSETESVVPCPLGPSLGLPDLHAPVRSTVTYLPDTSYEHTPTTCFEPKLVPGTQIPYPGFPSLHVLPIASHSLEPVGLNCFGSPSKYPNCVLTLHNLPPLTTPLQVLASQVLGKSLYINWPMMHEAQVVGLTNETGQVLLDIAATSSNGKNNTKKKKQTKTTTTTTNNKNKQQQLKFTPFTAQQSERWRKESLDMKQSYHTGTGVPGSGGVVISGDENSNPIPFRLLCRPLQGLKTIASTGATRKVWASSHLADIPLQLALWSAPAGPDPRYIENAALSIQDRFPLESSVLFVQGKYKGTLGKVVAHDTRVVGVECTTPTTLSSSSIESVARRLVQAVQQQTQYLSSGEAASILKIPPNMFGKLMGSLPVQIHGQGSAYDVGLNLKYASGSSPLYVVGYTRATKKGGSAAAAAPWKAGDSLQVVGSDTTTNNNHDDSNSIIKWEYTPRAIKLVHAYRQAFPQLFQYLNTNPNNTPSSGRGGGRGGGNQHQPRPYNATSELKGKLDLSTVKTYLETIETANLPRTPLTTTALPREAIWAIQKASDLLLLNNKKNISTDANTNSNNHSTEQQPLFVKVPPAALYRYGSTTSVSLLDFSGGTSPTLGGRVANVCANGVPFGLLGTVVGIHDSSSGCVEVVMDQEFVGGGTLQGAVSSFRGKLCWYNHLLPISTTCNTMSEEEKEKQKQQQPVDDLVANLKQELNPTTTTTTANAKKNAWGTATKQQQQQQPKTPIPTTGWDARPKSRPRSTLKGGGVKTLWKEAKKPPENVVDQVGFRGKRNGSKSGFQRWKSLTREGATQQLRALLGVTQISPAAAAPTHTNNNTQQQAATAGLKALLGVVPPQQQQHIPVVQTNNGSMPLLPPHHHHVGSSSPYAQAVMMNSAPPPPPMMMQSPLQMMPPPPPQQQMMPPPPPQQMMPQPSTSAAADKLLQMMRQPQQQQYPPTMNNAPPPPPHPSTFNFTYVESKEPK